VRLVLPEGAPPPELPDARIVERAGEAWLLAHRGPPGPLLAALAALDPLDVTIEEAGLEEIFLDYYRADAE
jgi:hypothetical protein